MKNTVLFSAWNYFYNYDSTEMPHKLLKLETVTIAEPLQNRQHVQNP